MIAIRLNRFLLFLMVLVCCCLSNYSATGQSFAIYDSMPQLESRIENAKDTTLVINFWATWCKPCIEELPCFEELRERYNGQNVLVILVSLDFKSQLEKKFIPFLKEKQFKSEVVLFADQDANTWIPKISQEWDGAIPATVIIKGQQRKFNLGKFANYTELETFVRPFLADVSVLKDSSQYPCLTGK
ncbi:MAG: TlpA family protein disulfide reductase [Bacteroidetes bacterium]|nr:TlpA family protein disulfide reductase [Bacteroidota bacterium]